MKLGISVAALLGLAPAISAQCKLDDIVSDPENPFVGRVMDVSTDGTTAILGAQEAAYIYEDTATGWREQAFLELGEPMEFSGFGSAVAVDGDVACVADHLEDSVAANSGAVWIYERTGTVWEETAMLKAPAPIPSQFFGTSVSVNGDRVLVGASECSSIFCPNPGSAYVFERAGSEWQLAQTLAGQGITGGDRFGSNVELEGSTILVTAAEDDDGAVNAGAVYVFEESPSGWTQVAKLVSSSPAVGDDFGQSLDLEGDLAFIGAPRGAPLVPEPNGGRVHVFERSGSAWLEAAIIEPSDLEVMDLFGFSLDARGDRLIVGAPGRDPTAETVGAGVARMFQQVDGAWLGAGELSDPQAVALAALGHSVALTETRATAGKHADGSTLTWDVRPFCASPGFISIGGGGIQSLSLQAGPAFAGDVYWVLGSASGTEPGIAGNGLLLPLVPDAWFLWTLANPNSTVLSNSLNTLNGVGKATAAFMIPGGLDPSLLGFTLHHAYVVFGTPGLSSLFASNAASTLLVQ